MSESRKVEEKQKQLPFADWLKSVNERYKKIKSISDQNKKNSFQEEILKELSQFTSAEVEKYLGATEWNPPIFSCYTHLKELVDAVWCREIPALLIAMLEKCNPSARDKFLAGHVESYFPEYEKFPVFKSFFHILMERSLIQQYLLTKIAAFKMPALLDDNYRLGDGCNITYVDYIKNNPFLTKHERNYFVEQFNLVPQLIGDPKKITAEQSDRVAEFLTLQLDAFPTLFLKKEMRNKNPDKAAQYDYWLKDYGKWEKLLRDVFAALKDNVLRNKLLILRGRLDFIAGKLENAAKTWVCVPDVKEMKMQELAQLVDLLRIKPEIFLPHLTSNQCLAKALLYGYYCAIRDKEYVSLFNAVIGSEEGDIDLNVYTKKLEELSKELEVEKLKRKLDNKSVAYQFQENAIQDVKDEIASVNVILQVQDEIKKNKEETKENKSSTFSSLDFFQQASDMSKGKSLDDETSKKNNSSQEFKKIP